MATPEQNALLAQGLFRQPAEDYAANSNQRMKILMGIAQANREEQLRRDLATQQATREDARWRAQGDREDARISASDARQAATISAAERRQTAAMRDKERADIENEFDRLYPQYAAAAARAGLEVKQRTDYETSRSGIGQLAADFETARVGYSEKNLMLAAESTIAELEDRKAQLAEQKNRIAELSKASPEDEKMARANAVAALRKAVANKEIESLEKLGPKAIDKGMAALMRGDKGEAARYLGDEAIGLFDNAFDQTLFQLPNVKSRMQEKAQAQQLLLALQREVSGVETAARTAAGANRYLAEGLKKSRTGMQQLMAPPEEPRRKSTFDSVTPPPQPAQTGQPAPMGAVTTPAAGTRPYSYPGGILGGIERLYRSETPERWMQAPGNIIMAPGQALDAAGRYGTAGLRGLFTGDFSVPKTSVMTPGLNAIGSLLGATPNQPGGL
jgi:hypothetical protein